MVVCHRRGGREVVEVWHLGVVLARHDARLKKHEALADEAHLQEIVNREQRQTRARERW